MHEVLEHVHQMRCAGSMRYTTATSPSKLKHHAEDSSFHLIPSRQEKQRTSLEGRAEKVRRHGVAALSSTCAFFDCMLRQSPNWAVIEGEGG